MRARLIGAADASSDATRSAPLHRAPLNQRQGADYEYGLFWPRNPGSTWPQFFAALFFSGDGIFTVALVCLVGLGLYRALGNPLDRHVEDKRRERVEMWEEHRRRFARRMPDGRLRSIGAASSAASREDPTGRDEMDCLKVEPVKINTVTVMLPAAEGKEEVRREVKVTVVGEREGSTLSVVTHHDICCGICHGLLPFSVDLLTEMARERGRAEWIAKKNTKGSMDSSTLAKPMKSVGNLGCCAGAHSSAERVCFYHISAPGHSDDGDDDWHDYCGRNESGWTMDALAGRMNRIVSRLGIAGRTVYLGEGAGANICLRAAAETAERAKGSRGPGPAPRPRFAVSGLALVSPERGGPTVGNSLTSTVASLLLRSGVGPTAVPLGMFGVPSGLLRDGEAFAGAAVGERRLGCLAAFAGAYYAPGTGRTRLGRRSRRAAALDGVPNLVLCAESSVDGRDRAADVCDVLDQARGSGVVAVSTDGTTAIGSRYVAGGGAVLCDRKGRKSCVDACKIFFEAL